MITIILATLIGILVLGLLVFIHEAGHFLAAKFFKVKVEEFGFGFPFPGRIFGIKRGETVYSLNWLPAGGFVKLYGEEGDAQGPRSFASKPWWQRAIIVAAGVIVNLTLAIILFTIIVASGGFKTDFNLVFDNKFPFGKQTNYVFVGLVDEKSPAKQAGLRAGDKVISVDGNTVEDVREFQTVVRNNLGEEIVLEVENVQDQNERTLNLTPRENPPPGEGAIGVSLGQGALLDYQSITDKVFVGVLHSANLLQFQWTGIKALFSQSVEEGTVEPLARNSSGPVGIVAAISVLVGAGGVQSLIILANFAALISLILGIANLLPIPAMDGGRLFFILLEGIRGKKINPKIENLIHTVGLVVLMVLFLLITFNDFVKIFTGRIFG